MIATMRSTMLGESLDPWTVDPVVAGSSPVVLAKQKSKSRKKLRLFSFSTPDPVTTIW